jgi:hypothetical protein
MYRCWGQLSGLKAVETASLKSALELSRLLLLASTPHFQPWLEPLLRIWDVPASNIGPLTGSPESFRGFLSTFMQMQA